MISSSTENFEQLCGQYLCNRFLRPCQLGLWIPDLCHTLHSESRSCAMTVEGRTPLSNIGHCNLRLLMVCLWSYLLNAYHNTLVTLY